jgi:hypothetical protein
VYRWAPACMPSHFEIYQLDCPFVRNDVQVKRDGFLPDKHGWICCTSEADVKKVGRVRLPRSTWKLLLGAHYNKYNNSDIDHCISASVVLRSSASRCQQCSPHGSPSSPAALVRDQLS